MLRREHSYEEIRAVAIDLLAERASGEYGNNQFTSFKANIASVLAARGQGDGQSRSSWGAEHGELSYQDDQLADEVFWDLLRQGIITLGLDRMNQGFPWFRVSSFGKRVIEQKEPYFFHDLSSYESAIRRAVPSVEDTILLYAKEAMQAYLSGCLLSAAVMIGVAVEGAFLRMVDSAEQNPTWNPTFKNAFEQRTVLQKLNKFLALAEQHLMKQLPSDVKENFNTNFTGVMNMIRNARNESGHPSGKIISREECFVLLRLFIPCCKKIYDLSAFFK